MMYIVNPFYEDLRHGTYEFVSYLSHHGIKGMKWGVRRTPEQLGHSKHSAIGLIGKMKDISYDDTPADKWRLKSPKDTERTKLGNCHDQVLFEANELRKMGINPKIKFMIEHDESGQGGVTHSFVYFNTGKKTCWVEHAWGDKQGLHEMDSVKAIKESIEKSHSKGEFGNNKSFPNISWGDLDDSSLEEGMSLQDLIDKVKWEN